MNAPENSRPLIIGIMVFDGAEEMDFVGPWEVFSAATEDMAEVRVLTVAPTRAPVICDKGLQVIADAGFDQVPRLDVVVIPGGGGAWRETGNPATVEWLRKIAPGCTWVTSVCTGAFLLVGAGLAQGKRVTTHHQFYDKLAMFDGIEVVPGQRFVRDGNVVTAGGVMSGIDMSLWLVGQLFGEKTLAYARDYVAFDYPPALATETGATETGS